jgi:hypothetical protein
VPESRPACSAKCRRCGRPTILWRRCQARRSLPPASRHRSPPPVVTSQNWGSASSNDSFPASEVGVHIVSSGLANHARDRLAEIYPDLLASAAKGS